MLCFIDEFDVYKNIYRSLIDIYFIIVAMTIREKSQRTNVFSLTLNSHESNVDEIIKVITSLK